MTDQPGTPYKVVRSEAIRQQLWAWGQRAVERGMAAEYAAALRVIEEQLGLDPATWGDPVKRMRSLGLLVCRRIHWDILVRYAIHEASRTVFIIGYELVLDNPLRPQNDLPSSNGSS